MKQRFGTVELPDGQGGWLGAAPKSVFYGADSEQCRIGPYNRSLCQKRARSAFLEEQPHCSLFAGMVLWRLPPRRTFLSPLLFHRAEFCLLRLIVIRAICSR